MSQTTTTSVPARQRPVAAHRADLPRIGFAGVGWIGRQRMQVLLESGLCLAGAIADPSGDNAEAAAALAPAAPVAASFEALLERDDLDGVVIATPSSAHASQSIAALDRGLSVFCQKPLGRDAAEVAAVVAAAQRNDRLLGVDLSYRHTAAMTAIRQALRDAEIGSVFAVDLVFHNAYGPDKAWFYDKAQSGGGCVMDLGVHLVDLALWALDFPEVRSVHSHLHAGGQALTGPDQVEDHAIATLTLANGASVRLACSWNLNAGREADIAARFYGTDGGLEMRNVDGSFYDFAAHAFSGTQSRVLASPPDAWGGRALIAWAQRLDQAVADPSAHAEFVAVAQVLDRIYAAARS